MKFKLILLMMLFFTCTLLSQRHLTSLTYNMAVPLSNTADFIGRVSYAGLGFESRIFVEKDFSVGAKIAWNTFDEKSERLFTGKNWAVSGTNIRTLNIFPFLVNAHYYIGDRKGTRLFIGANTGLYYISQNFQLGVAELFESNWHFGITPEVGMVIAIDNDLAFILNLDYNYAFDSGTSVTGKEDNSHSYAGINIGLAWDVR